MIEAEKLTTRNNFITNYPHFRYWKKDIVNDLLTPKPLNLYIHVPFCLQKCSYCYYKITLYKGKDQTEQFTDAIIEEITNVCQKFNLFKRPVNSIYFGGGTPSLLKVEQLSRIMDTFHKLFTITNPEVTIENEPRTILQKKVSAYKELGFNRISMGTQSLDDDMIKSTGRGHSSNKVFEAIDLIKNAGGFVTNIDLLSGLPNETMENWLKTVDRAIETNVENLTFYKMQVYANTVFFDKNVRKNEIAIPSEEEEISLMSIALDRLEGSQYKLWSNFTFISDEKYKQEYINNTWAKDEDSYGFGPSAFGKLGEFNIQNYSDFTNYYNSINNNELPINRAFKLSSKDLMIRDIDLRFKFQIFSRKDFVARHGFDVCNLVPETIEELKQEGFIELKEDFILQTKKAMLYCDYVGRKISNELAKYLKDFKYND